MKYPQKYDYKNFLSDDKFVEWRFFKNEELDEYWSNYEKDHPEEKEALLKAIEIFDTVTLNNYSPSEIQYNSLLRKLRKSTVYRKRKIRKLRCYAASVACLAVLIVSSFIYQNLLPQDHKEDNNYITGETGNNEDIRLIGSGKSLSLSQDVEIRLEAGGQAAVLNKKGENIESIELSSQELNKLIVPYGKRSTLILSDGTKIWLNSGTEIEFPAVFKGNTRDINIQGEIYLDVKENKHKPFFIHTSQFDVKVVGTKFNVSAYNEDAINSIVLVEGKVEVNCKNNTVLSMSPNEMVAIGSNGTTKSTVDVNEYISWMDGIIYLNKVTLTEILNKVGRYYNVSFDKSKDIAIAQETYSGKLILSDNLDDVMKSVSAFTSTIYERNQNKILIKSK